MEMAALGIGLWLPLALPIAAALSAPFSRNRQNFRRSYIIWRMAEARPARRSSNPTWPSEVLSATGGVRNGHLRHRLATRAMLGTPRGSHQNQSFEIWWFCDRVIGWIVQLVTVLSFTDALLPSTGYHSYRYICGCWYPKILSLILCTNLANL